MRQKTKPLTALTIALILTACVSEADGAETTNSMQDDSVGSTTTAESPTSTSVETTTTQDARTSTTLVADAYAHPECEEIEMLASWYVDDARAQLLLKEAARDAEAAGDANIFRDGLVEAAETYDLLAQDVSNFYENDSELLGLSGALALVILETRQEVYDVVDAMLSEDGSQLSAALTKLDDSPEAIEVAEDLAEGLELCPFAQANVEEKAEGLGSLLP